MGKQKTAARKGWDKRKKQAAARKRAAKKAAATRAANDAANPRAAKKRYREAALKAWRTRRGEAEAA